MPNQAGEFSPAPELEAEMEISESPDSGRETRLMRRAITLYTELRPRDNVKTQHKMAKTEDQIALLN